MCLVPLLFAAVKPIEYKWLTVLVMMFSFAQVCSEVAVQGLMVQGARKNLRSGAADLFTFAVICQQFGLLLSRFSGALGFIDWRVGFSTLAIPAVILVIAGAKCVEKQDRTLGINARCNEVCSEKNCCRVPYFAKAMLFVLLAQTMPTWENSLLQVEYEFLTIFVINETFTFGTYLAFFAILMYGCVFQRFEIRTMMMMAAGATTVGSFAAYLKCFLQPGYVLAFLAIPFFVMLRNALFSLPIQVMFAQLIPAKAEIVLFSFATWLLELQLSAFLGQELLLIDSGFGAWIFLL